MQPNQLIHKNYQLLLWCLFLLLVNLPVDAQERNLLQKGGPPVNYNQAQDSIFSSEWLHLNVLNKSDKKKHIPDSTHSPLLALRRSAAIPGWGQVYNHKWWKLPVIYTGLGLFGQAIVSNQRSYNKYLQVYKYYRDPTKATPGKPYVDLYTKLKSQNNQDVIFSAVSGYQRNMQLSILGFLGFWGIQMIDAYIDGKFIHSYTMDNNLSLQLSPTLTHEQFYTANNVSPVMPTLKLTVSF